MVLWFLAEGLDQAVLIRFTGHSEATIARWLERVGAHSQAWHHCYLRLLALVVLQLDELHSRVRSVAKTGWLWLVIDPLSSQNKSISAPSSTLSGNNQLELVADLLNLHLAIFTFSHTAHVFP